MKIITLTGDHNVGKTTTLKIFYETLKGQGAKDILAPRQCAMSSNDYEYFVQYNDRKVAIVTMGDFAAEINWHIGYFDAKGADILVIADSWKSGYKKIVKCHKYELCPIIKKTEPIEANRSESNMASVNDLISSIR